MISIDHKIHVTFIGFIQWIISVIGAYYIYIYIKNLWHMAYPISHYQIISDNDDLLSVGNFH